MHEVGGSLLYAYHDVDKLTLVDPTSASALDDFEQLARWRTIFNP